MESALAGIRETETNQTTSAATNERNKREGEAQVEVAGMVSRMVADGGWFETLAGLAEGRRAEEDA